MAVGFIMCRINYPGYSNLKLSGTEGRYHTVTMPSAYQSSSTGGYYVSLYYWVRATSTGSSPNISTLNSNYVFQSSNFTQNGSLKWVANSNLPSYECGFRISGAGNGTVTYAFDMVVFICTKRVDGLSPRPFAVTAGDTIVPSKMNVFGSSFSAGQIIRLSDLKLTSQCEGLETWISDGGKLSASKWNSSWNNLA